MEGITKLGPAHAEELAVLNSQLIQDEGHSNPMGVDELTERMRVWLSGRYSCYGIVNDGEIVAYCLYHDNDDFYYLRQLFTARQCREQGMASRLLQFLESRAFLGKPIRLEVLAGNSNTMRFYAARGYRVYCHTLVKDG